LKYLAALLISVMLALPVFPETKLSEPAGKEKSKGAALPAGSLGISSVRAKSGGRIFTGESVILTATVYDIKGVPQQNRRIDFSAVKGAGRSAPTLVKATGITDKYGNVSVEMIAGSEAAEFNVVRALAPGVKNPNANSALFKIKAWSPPLERLAANYSSVEDFSAARIDSGVAGGKELSESRTLYFARKPDMSKSVKQANSASYTIFKGGVSCSYAPERNPLKTDIAAIMGVPYAQVNYQYAPESFLAAHAVQVKLVDKPGADEMYCVEAAPKTENKAYSCMVIYIDYITGLDVEVDKYGPDKTIASRSVIKRAAQYDLSRGCMTGRVYDSGRPSAPNGAEEELSCCWIPVETETTTYFGSVNTVIRTRFEDIKVNTGISEAEFTIP